MRMLGRGAGRGQSSPAVREQQWQKDARSVAVAWGAGCRGEGRRELSGSMEGEGKVGMGEILTFGASPLCRRFWCCCLCGCWDCC